MTVTSADFGAGGSYYCMSLPMLDMKPRCERCDTLLPDEELAFICADLAREAKMGGLSLRLLESLHRKLREVAESEGVSINQWISSAVAEKMSALMTEEYLGARAKRGSRRKFQAVLAKIPDVEPDDSDRIPAVRRRSRRKAG